jgi:hypothetical protein
MRLISCIGMLMVIPAVGLLTIKNDPQVKKTPAINTHRRDKIHHQTKVKLIGYVDSTQHDKMDHVDLATSVHPAVSGSSDAKANPLFTK